MKRKKGNYEGKNINQWIENKTKNNKEDQWIKTDSSEKNSKTNKRLVRITNF